MSNPIDQYMSHGSTDSSVIESSVGQYDLRIAVATNQTALDIECDRLLADGWMSITLQGDYLEFSSSIFRVRPALKFSTYVAVFFKIPVQPLTEKPVTHGLTFSYDPAGQLGATANRRGKPVLPQLAELSVQLKQQGELYLSLLRDYARTKEQLNHERSINEKLRGQIQVLADMAEDAQPPSTGQVQYGGRVILTEEELLNAYGLSGSPNLEQFKEDDQ